MKKRTLGFGVLGVGIATILGFAACSAAPERAPVERAAEVVQPLVQVVETPSIAGFVTALAGSTRGNLDAPVGIDGKFNDPTSVAVSADGSVYVTDWGNNSIRIVGPNRSLGTIVPGRPNLLQNPGCEEPPPGGLGIPSWVGNGNERPKTQCPGGTCGFAYDGSSYCWGGHSSISTTLSQTVTVTSDVLAGRKIHVSGFQRSSPQETTQVRVEYLSSTGAVLSSWQTPEVTVASWTPFVDERTAPANTTRVRLSLRGRATSGSDANSYFDSLIVRAVPNAGDTSDAGLIGPKSLVVDPLAPQLLIAAANGVFSTSLTGGSVTKLAASGGYTPPARANSMSVTGGGYVVVADALSPKLHVRTPGNWWYYANLPITGEVLSAVGAEGSGPSGLTSFFFVTTRGSHQINGYVCPRDPAQGSTVTCSVAPAVPPFYPTPILGAVSAGFVNDLDGTLGQERFTYPSVLSASGLSGPGPLRPDFFISEEGNHTVRRNFTDFTSTVMGTGTSGVANGPAAFAQLNSPGGAAVMPDGTLVVADRMNNKIRRIPCGGAGICSGGGFGVGSPAQNACPTFQVADDVACTRDTCELIGIRHRPKSSGESCSDLNLCNGEETCNAAGTCVAGTPLTVDDDNNSCTIKWCDPNSGVQARFATSGTACTTDACSLPGTCNGSGQCNSGGPLPTEDGNECTTGTCGANGLVQTLKPVGSPCSGGTCDANGSCKQTLFATAPAEDRTVPTPPNKLWDDFLGVSGGQPGDTACVKSAAQPTCAFEPTHMALVRGVVKNATGGALSGSATVSVINHPEYGTTQTRANGEFFLVVNGGGPLTIRVSKSGVLSSDRDVNPPWGGTEITPDIALIPLDPTATSLTIPPDGGLLASGSTTPAALGDAARQASVYFPSTVKAKANGVDVTSAKFRVTEYTTGANGRDRMPADVADNTMYTYASEFTLEDAEGIVYQDVSFFDTVTGEPKPVFAYLTNFIGMTEGNGVPVGYYNRQAGRWEPMDNGRVISVDAAGAVTCGAGCTFTGIGGTPEELQKLAVYKGMKVWRMPLLHFSPLDFNLRIGAPPCEGTGAAMVCPGAPTAETTGGDDTPTGGSCKASGSIIEVERQVLRETFPVVGTPFSLNYSSENTLGYGWNKTLGIDLRNEPAHSKRKGFVVDFKVAGKRVVYGSPPTDRPYQVAWDGRDHAGRPVQGAITATLDVGAVYTAVAGGATRFGTGRSVVDPAPTLEGTRQNPEIILWKRHQKKLQVRDASALGFGGWTLSGHHAYDPEGNVLYLGDGTHRTIAQTGAIMTYVAGKPVPFDFVPSPDGTPAADAVFDDIESLAVSRGGEVFLATGATVRTINIVHGQYGTVRDYAGKHSGTANVADPDWAPKPALAGHLRKAFAIALHDDGRLVILDSIARRIYEVSADGATIKTVAGKGNGSVPPSANCGSFSDNTFSVGTPARPGDGIALCYPTGLAVGPDGSVYFSDNAGSGRGYVVRIDTSGHASVIAGVPHGTDVIPATGGSATYFDQPEVRGADARRVMLGLYTAIAVDRNNTLWMDTGDGYHLVAVPPNGQIQPYRIPGRAYSVGLDLSVLPTGEILRTSGEPSTGGPPHSLLRCSTSGACTRFAGASVIPSVVVTNNMPAMSAALVSVRAATAGPEGSSYIAVRNCFDGSRSCHTIFKVGAPAATASLAQCKYRVPSEDASEIYCFNDQGRHLSTHHGLTSAVTRSFCYGTPSVCDATATGLLTKVVEADGRETIIDRSVSTAVTIRSPNQQPTTITLDSQKVYATRIAGDGTIDVQHGGDGLLTAMNDVNTQPHAFAYDKFGRLQKDYDAGGGYKVLSRVDDSASKYTINMSTRLGKTSSNAWQRLADGQEQRDITLLSGLKNISTVDTAGKRTTTFADKTVVTAATGPDPRFGMAAPFVNATTFSAPGVVGAPSLSTTTTRTLGADGQSLTEQTTVTGATTRVFTSAYDNATRTITATSPVGRVEKYILDAQGRVISYQAPGVPAVDYTINPTTGLLDKVSQGTGRVINLGYSTAGANKGFLTSVDDPHPTSDIAPTSTTLLPDDKGRLLSQTRNSVPSVLTQFTWTNDGQLKTLTPPDLSPHQFEYDTRGDLEIYTPPAILSGGEERTSYARDFDRYLQSIDAPGVDDVSLITDSVTGQLTRVRLGSNHEVALSYYSAGASCLVGCSPGRLSTVTDVGSGTTMNWGWVGSLPATAQQGGSTVSWAHNNNFWTTSETLARTTPSAHSSPVTFDYDADGLLTCASLGTCVVGQAERIGITRDAVTGWISSVKLGASLDETYGYNAYGELKFQDSTPYRIDYEDVSTPRDALGRVKRRAERVGNTVTLVYNYTYDDKGRLWKVTGASGTLISEYRYDQNGTRTYVKNSEGTIDDAAGNFLVNEQDQLLKYGSTTFTYSPKGDLSVKKLADGSSFIFDYDAAGGLRHVALPNGSTIEYVLDGLGRRVGKKLNSQLRKQWVYGSGLAPIAELDGAGAVTMRFVYGSKPNVPDFIKVYATSKLYRVFSDRLGTPRAIHDVLVGTTYAPRFDEFGIKLSDDTPFESPFGFAGGLYDPDTKLTRFGARDYDASIGRWLSKDPILFRGGQANLYAYVGNDPVNWLDPSGLYWIDENGVRNWDEWESQRLLDEAITDYAEMSLPGNLCAATLNSSRVYDGRYDFKVHPFFRGDYFWVPGVGRMNASSFGNYFAGYVNYATLGRAGTSLTRAGGWLSHVGPSDDAASTELINRAESDARQRFHGWGGPPARFGNGG